MKNVLLIGDSIRIGYDKSVKKTLEGLANVYFPIAMTLSGMEMLDNLVHPRKALVPMSVTPLGIIMLVKFLHERNAEELILVTLFGIVMLSKEILP